MQTPGATYAYCNRPIENELDMTCRDIGAKVSFSDKVKNNEIWQIHQRAYKKYFARARKGNMTYLEMAQQLCEEHSNYWDYYRIHRHQSFFEHFRNLRLFIRSTFQHAQKQGLINRDNTEQPEISEARAAHSISAFFLGFMLAKNLENGRVLHFYRAVVISPIKKT